MKKRNAFAILYFAVLLFLFGCTLAGSDKDNENPKPQLKVGDTLWVHHLSMGEKELWIHDQPLALGKDGTIYYSASGGQANWLPEHIYAINKADGSLKWKSSPLAIWHLNGNIIVGDDGTLYVESYTKLYALDAATGTFKWVWEVPQSITVNGHSFYTYGELGGMALSNNGNIITKTNGSGSYYRAMYCIGANGSVKWYRFIGAENTPITIGYQGAVYDFEHDDSGQILTAANPATGALLWTMPESTPTSFADNIIIADNGDILFYVASDMLMRMQPVDRHVVWKKVASTSSKAKIFGPNGHLFLFDQWAGTTVFNIQTGDKSGAPLKLPVYPLINSKAELLGTNGDVYPFLYVADNKGNVKWENKMDNFYGKTIAVSDENTIYVANSKKVYAIKGGATLAKSGWPKFTHDNRNTFNYSKH